MPRAEENELVVKKTTYIHVTQQVIEATVAIVRRTAESLEDAKPLGTERTTVGCQLCTQDPNVVHPESRVHDVSRANTEHASLSLEEEQHTSQGPGGLRKHPWARYRQSCSDWQGCHWEFCPPWSGWSCGPRGWRWPPSWTRDPTACWSLTGQCCSRWSFSLWSRTHCETRRGQPTE